MHPGHRRASLVFLGGWLLGLAALTAAFVAAFRPARRTARGAANLGVLDARGPRSALIMFGIFRLLTRHRQTDPPRWMSSVRELTPIRAGLVGAVLAPIRPEVLIVCATAGLAIGTGDFGDAGRLA